MMRRRGGTLKIKESVTVNGDGDGAVVMSGSFLMDILQKCGNLRIAGAQASHCRLSMGERQDITQEVLTNTHLSMIFNQVQYRTLMRKKWADAFDHYFSPLDGKILVQPQNFPSMLYWGNWSELKNLCPTAVGYMRGQLRLLFDQLLWVPQKVLDRVWVYNRSDISLGLHF